MEKQKIEDYIKKLSKFENDLNNGEDDPDDFIKELDSLLRGLSSDIQESYGPNSINLPVNIKKLHPGAVIPAYSKDGDAGLDLTAVNITHDKNGNLVCDTGLAMEIPRGYVGLLFPRSSITKKTLSLANCVGVIDSGYRGEIKVIFKPTIHFNVENFENDFLVYKIGDRVAQILIIPYPQIKFIEVENLSESIRGDGGFGSTNI